MTDSIEAVNVEDLLTRARELLKKSDTSRCFECSGVDNHRNYCRVKLLIADIDAAMKEKTMTLEEHEAMLVDLRNKKDAAVLEADYEKAMDIRNQIDALKERYKSQGEAKVEAKLATDRGDDVLEFLASLHVDFKIGKRNLDEILDVAYALGRSDALSPERVERAVQKVLENWTNTEVRRIIEHVIEEMRKP